MNTNYITSVLKLVFILADFTGLFRRELYLDSPKSVIHQTFLWRMDASCSFNLGDVGLSFVNFQIYLKKIFNVISFVFPSQSSVLFKFSIKLLACCLFSLVLIILRLTWEVGTLGGTVVLNDSFLEIFTFKSCRSSVFASGEDISISRFEVALMILYIFMDNYFDDF